jgi:hypothetical protein
VVVGVDRSMGIVLGIVGPVLFPLSREDVAERERF